MVDYLGGPNFDRVLETSRAYQRAKGTDSYEVVGMNPPDPTNTGLITPTDQNKSAIKETKHAKNK